MEVILNIESEAERKRVVMTSDSITIGRSAASATVVVNDEGLSRLHAAIHRNGDELRLLDQQSVNGTYLNCEIVPPGGKLLADGDEIFMGNCTVIKVSIEQTSRQSSMVEKKTSWPGVALLFAAPLIVITILICAAVISKMTGTTGGEVQAVESGTSTEDKRAENPQHVVSVEPTAAPSPSLEQTNFPREDLLNEEHIEVPQGTLKLYKNLSDEEKERVY